MKVVVRTLSVVLAVSVTIAAIAAGALYVDGPTVYQGPDLLGGSVQTCTGDRPASRASFGRSVPRRHGGPTRLSDRLPSWNNLQDLGYTDPPDQFDFEEYLRFLELRNHNFIRMWRSESPRVSGTGSGDVCGTPPPGCEPGPAQRPTERRRSISRSSIRRTAPAEDARPDPPLSGVFTMPLRCWSP